MSVNKTIHVGHCAEPEIFKTDNGVIAKFGLAINESYTNKAGDKVENTQWFNVVCYNKTAEIVEKWVKKGQQLYIEGKLVNRSWETKEGNKRYSIEIVVDGFNGTNLQMLGGKSESKQETAPPHTEDDIFPG